jgi:hypothetical protein
LHIWSLPGPRSFLDAVADSTRRRGLVGIVAPPHMPEGLVDALREVLRFSHELRMVEYRSGTNPLDALAEVFDLDLRSARSLAEDPRASGKAVLLVGLDAAGALNWDATMRAFASGAAKRSRYAASILVSVSPPEASVLKASGATLHLWRGVVTRSDAMLMALSAIEHPSEPLGTGSNKSSTMGKRTV